MLEESEDYSLFSTRSNLGSSNRYLKNGEATKPSKHWNTLRKHVTQQSVRAVLLSLHATVKTKSVKENELQLISSVRNVLDTYTIVAYVNSGSGGGKGSVIYGDLVTILGKDHVFDLKDCRKDNMPEDHLFKFALDPMVRVLACGGDGTIGWIETAIDKVWEKVLGPDVTLGLTSYADHLPVAIIPLGTGNDLSRSFGWGGTYNKKMVRRSYMSEVATASLSHLDRWRCVIIPESTLDEETRAWVPQMLQEQMKGAEEKELISDLFESMRAANQPEDNEDDALSEEGEGGNAQAFDGIFCNYFSIGFDAKIAFNFHKEREKHPDRFTSPFKNKLIYAKKSMAKSPRLKGRVKLLVAGADDQLHEIAIPSNCRSIVLMNIQSYGGGNKLLSEGSKSDGLIEVFFMSSLAKMVGAAITPVKCEVAAKAKRVVLKTEKVVHCQVDGEPWRQTKAFFQISHHSANSFLKKNPKQSKYSCTKRKDVVKDHAIVQEDSFSQKSLEEIRDDDVPLTEHAAMKENIA